MAAAIEVLCERLGVQPTDPSLLELALVHASWAAEHDAASNQRLEFLGDAVLGLVVAVSNLDEVVRIIRGSANPALARETLMAREWPIGEIAPYIRLVEAIEDEALGGAGGSYRLSETQVRAILDLRLHRLTALGRD